jgi:hypothetical protein
MYRALALLVAVWLPACAGPAIPEPPLAETRQDLVRSLVARGWVVEPLALADLPGLSVKGTRYTVRQQRRDEREIHVYEYAEDDRGAIPADVQLLLGRTAGLGTTLYRRPGLVVLTFGRTWSLLDTHLARVLGPPVEVRSAEAQ